MRLAIIIGVPTYKKPIQDLPACKRDAQLVSELLNLTKKYEQVLDLSSETSSAVLKTRLAQFIEAYKGNPVDEILFYYSGHGDVYKDEFYYLLADFQDARRQQTSLRNDELDQMLRALSPQLAVKVVDACHAGVAYIKEADVIEKSLTKSKGGFARCYFMFSSLESQQSFQDERLSHFTRSFLAACAEFKGPEIRFRDVVDFVADDFAKNDAQTPTFVIQASNTEVFCNLTSEIHNFLSNSLAPEPAASHPTGATKKDETPRGMVELVKMRAKDYCTKDEALAFFTAFAKALEAHSYGSEAHDLYDFTVSFDQDYGRVRNAAAIGNWLKENRHGFFAHETYGEEMATVLQPKKRRYDYGLIIGAYQETEMEEVRVKRQVVIGFDLTAESPYRVVVVEAKPKFENVPPAACIISFVFSKVECAFFYSLQWFNEHDWGKLTLDGSPKWVVYRLAMKQANAAQAAAEFLCGSFEAFLLQRIRELVGIAQTQAGKADAAPGTGAPTPKPKKS